jgi:hypothetical protein
VARNAEQKRAKQRECMQRWRESHRDIARARNRAHYQTTKQVYILRSRGRLDHAPPWLTKEHWREMAGLYERAQQLTLATGVVHVVDHIWPLKGARSCGLHVPWNLQVVTHRFNIIKSRKEPEASG